MSISLLRTFIAIAETGSFRAAADKVCVTHVAVGQQMRRLEDALGVVLFDRSQRALRLNHLGKTLVPKAKAVVAAYDTILDDLTGDPRVIGELVLGAVPSSIRALIPMALKRLVTTYPDLHVRVIPGLTPELHEQVERGAIDAAVISEPPRIAAYMNWRPFAREEMMLLTSSELRETDVRAILETAPYIRHTSQASVGMLAEDWLLRNRIKVRDMMEMGSLENLTSMIAHNLGVSVGPDLCVADPVFETLRKIPLGPGAPSRVLGVMTRADCAKIRLVDRLFEQVVATVGAHNPGALI